MKTLNYKLLIIFLCLFNLINAQTVNDSKLEAENEISKDTAQDSRAVFYVKKDTLLFGEIMQGDVLNLVFKFQNTGNQALLITSVVGDCSCTAPEWTTGEIAPGEEGEIVLKYDSKDDLGKVLKTATVLHNSGEGYSFLTIMGAVAMKF